MSSLFARTLRAALLVCLGAAAFAHEGAAPKRDEALQKKLIQVNENAILLDGQWPNEPGDWTPAAIQNPIDEITFAKMQQDGVPINALSSDEMFIRRVHLLLTGRLPEPETTRAFLADASPTKRAALIDEVMASEAFDVYWSFWFQEYFQSNTALLRTGVTAYNYYFQEAVRQRKPLDVMARELMTTMGENSETGEANFFIRANGMARLRQDFWDNAAIHAAEKFLGVPLDCISCHDGAYHLENINLYLADRKREDLWGMAAFFSGVNRRIGDRLENGVPISFEVFQRPTAGYLAQSDAGDRPPREGGVIEPKYLFSGAAPADGKAFHEAFAEMITADRQFARNFANRLWGHLLGLAMVEPMDGFDLYRIDPERELPEGWERQALDLNLLEHATQKLIDLKFDLKDYLRYVMNSATFQMSSTFAPGNWQETHAPYYTRYLARRMSAESVHDSIVAATGVRIPIMQAGRLYQAPPVDYAHQLIDNYQPRGRGQTAVRNFLDAFGRGDRYETPRTSAGNIGQALEMMNSDVVAARTAMPENRLYQYVDQGMDAEAIVEELFIDILCRKPTAEEAQALLAEMANYDTATERATTIQWLLLNRVEFTFIY